MATAAPATPPNKSAAVTPQVIADRLTSLHEKVDKYVSVTDGLLEKLQKPASAVGMSPVEFVSKMTDGGNKSIFVGHDGSVTFPNDRRMHGRRIGTVKVKDEATGAVKAANFGEYAAALNSFFTNGEGADKSSPFHGPEGARKAFQYLQSLGSERIYVDKNNAIIKTALAESSGITGGYTVPPMFSQEILRLAMENAIMRPGAMKIPLTARTLLIPALDYTTSYGAGISPFGAGLQPVWTAEAATRAESEPQFRQFELTAWELSFYALASNTLLADNAVGLDSLLTELFSMVIGWYTDYAYLQGNGVGKPLGVLNAPATIQVTRQTASRVTWQDVANMLSKIYWMLSQDSLCWVGHQSIIPQLYQLNDQSGTAAGTGRALFIPLSEGIQAKIPQPEGAMSFGTLAGFPVLITEKVPALGTLGDLMLIDRSKYVLGDRMDLQVEVSPHVQFLRNQLAWRVVWRGDGQPWLNGAITLADGSQQVSAFVALK